MDMEITKKHIDRPHFCFPVKNPEMVQFPFPGFCVVDAQYICGNAIQMGNQGTLGVLSRMKPLFAGGPLKEPHRL